MNKIKPFFVGCCANPYPTAYDESLSYYEEVCKIAAKLNEVINSQNSIITDFKNIVTWVNTQLENYTIQQLNEWLADGTLEGLLLNSLSITRSFKTVAEMKETNLVNGNIAKTIGYNSVNDNGGAFYLITKSQPSGWYETLNNGLYAELILESEMTFSQFGLIPNTQTDQHDLFQNVFNFLETNDVIINDTNLYYIKAYGHNTESNLIIKSNTTIKNTTFKLMDTNDDFTYMFGIYNASNILFDNVTFDQNIANNTQMTINVDPNVRSWWTTFYTENIKNVTWNKCVSNHQGIWFINLSNNPSDITENITVTNCIMNRHYKAQSTWYDSTDIFMSALNSKVENCRFISDSIDSQTALELHCSFNTATNNYFNGYKNGIIITNTDSTLITMKKEETFTNVLNNTFVDVNYGVIIYDVSHMGFNGINISNNNIKINQPKFGTGNSYGICSQQFTTYYDMWLKNTIISNNIIDFVESDYTSTDPFSLTSLAGIGIPFNGNIENLSISNNIINNALGVGISISTLTNTSGERANCNNVKIHHNTINNPLSDSNLAVSSNGTSCYIYFVGHNKNCMIGQNTLTAGSNQPLYQVRLFNSISANDDTIALLQNYTQDQLNTKWVNMTTNTTNATQNRQPKLYVDDIGMVHLSGDLTVINNGKVVATMPVEYVPETDQNIFGTLNISSNGMLSSYAGANNRVYLDGIIYKPSTYNRPDVKNT
jgi:hypothetical protein